MALTYVVNHSTLKTNLVSWWSLNEESDGTGAVTRLDSHGSNDLTDNNTTASATGNVNRGADFEASNSEYLNDTSYTGLDLSTNYSISVWVKWESTSGNMAIVSKQDDDLDINYTVFWLSTGTLVFRRSFSGTRHDINYTFTPTTGVWYHFVFVQDNSSGGYIYKDGNSTAVASDSNTGTVDTQTTMDFNMGVRSRSNDTIYDMYHDGMLQNFGIWSKALTTSEISDLYNSGDGMAYGVDFDSVTNAGIDNPTTSMTYSHTCTGTDRFLVVGTQAGATATGVTYNGVSMTLLDTQGLLKFWYLVAPATGANNVVITLASSTYCMSGATSYTGVDQTTPTDVNTKGTLTSTDTLIETLTTSTDYSWTVLPYHDGGGADFTPSAGTTNRVWTSGLGYGMVDSGSAITPAGSNSLGGTRTTASNWAMIMATIVPVQEAAASTFTPKVIMY